MKKYLKKGLTLKQIPLYIFLLIITIGLSLWVNNYFNQKNILSNETQINARYTADLVESNVNARIELIDILTHDWARVTNESELFDYNRYLDKIAYYYQYYTSYMAINWIDSEGVIRWVYPYDPNYSAINRSIVNLLTGDLNYAFYIARTTGKVGLTNVTNLFQGGKGLVTYQPIQYYNTSSLQNTTIGYFNVVLRINEFIEDIVNQTLIKDQYSMKILEYNQEIFNHSSLSFDNPYLVSQKISFYGREWTLYLCPNQAEIFRNTVADQLYLVLITFLGAFIALELGNKLYKKSLELELSYNEKKIIEQKLIQSQKIESLGTLAGGLAHDFNNIIMGLQGNFSIMTDIINSDEQIQEKLSLQNKQDWSESQNFIEDLFYRAKDLTSQILQFTRQTSFQLIPIEINSSIEQIVKIFSTTIDKRIEIITTIPHEKYYFLGEMSRFHLILTNLLVNSRDALPNGGKIEIKMEKCARTKTTPITNSEFQLMDEDICIIIRDNGIGIAPENMHKLFDPFFTTKPKGKGTGLGLAIVYNAVKHLNGAIQIESEKDHWTQVTIYYPLIKYDAINNQIVQNQENSVHSFKNVKILFAEDEESIRIAFTKQFTKLGIESKGFANGKDALEYYRKNPKEFLLIILDVNLPGFNGVEIYNEIKKIDPSQHILFITGYSDFQIPDLSQKNIHLLSKPFNMNELIKIIEEISQLY